jgi:DNA-binding IclR family transcriptional regulator
LAGLVEQDPRSLRYGLGSEIVRLSERYLDRLPTLRALSPYLRELRDTTKTTILVAVLVRTSIIYVDRVDGEEGAGVFRESQRVHEALGTAAGRILLARGAPEAWGEAVDGRTRPSNRDRRAWADAPFLLLGPDGDRSTVEVAVPVLDRAGMPLAALCARGDPAAFPEDVLKNDVAPQLVRAARAAGRAMADG